MGRVNAKATGRSFHKPFEVAYREIAELRNFRRLEHLFIEADADRSGEMSLDEFRTSLRKPWVQRPRDFNQIALNSDSTFAGFHEIS